MCMCVCVCVFVCVDVLVWGCCESFVLGRWLGKGCGFQMVGISFLTMGWDQDGVCWTCVLVWFDYVGVS